MKISNTSTDTFTKMNEDPQNSWRSILTNLSDAIWEWDTLNNQFRVSVNDQTFLCCRNHNDVNNLKEWLALIHPEDRNLVMNGLDELKINLSKSMVMQHRIMASDKSWKWVLNRASCMTPISGESQPSNFIGYLTDIDAFKSTESLLKECENRFHSFMYHMSFPAWIVDIDGCVVFCNDAFAKLLRTSVHTIIGNSIYRLFAKDQGKTFDQNNKYVIEKMSQLSTEEIAPRLDGSIGTYLVVKFPIFQKHENEVLAGGIAVDITPMRETEIALKKLNTQVEKASHAKDTFLATMSHEIRSPLNGVIGMSEILANMNLSPPQQECLAAIRYSAETLLGIINDILDFSKIEAGRLELELLEFDLESLLNEMVQSYRLIHRDRSIKIHLEIHGKWSRKFFGDVPRIRQILNNLVSNAIKFTSQGNVWIKVREIKRDNNMATLGFEVIDQGIGIALEHMSRLFEPFSQGDSSTTRKYGGTGLGLSICKRLVELMGGKIEVESKVGQGSTFRVQISLAVSPQKSPCPLSDQGQRRHLLQVVGKKVLVVDDSRINQQIAVSVLENIGFQVYVANSGREALDFMQQESFVLIFMDCLMPFMDGYEATRRIRSTRFPLNPHPIIVAMTANAIQGDRERCLDSGMDDYMSKPVRIRDFEDIVDKWVRTTDTGNSIN